MITLTRPECKRLIRALDDAAYEIPMYTDGGNDKLLDRIDALVTLLQRRLNPPKEAGR